MENLVKKLEEQITFLQQEISQISKELYSQQKEIKDLKNEITNLNKRIEDMDGEIVSKSDHSTEILKYPLIIQPDQPMVKFNNLSYEMFDSIDLNIRFDGIHFEMEDQRNWGDASYKIYSGSLLDPFPYKENKNSAFHQEIEITMREKNNSFGAIPNQNILPNNIREEFTMPKIGIKVDNETSGIDLVNVDFLYHLVDF